MTELKTPENVLFPEVDGKAVLLALEESCYDGLDEVGTTTWKLIGQEKLETERIAEHLTEVCEVDAEHARKDLDTFLADLQESGLIQQ